MLAPKLQGSQEVRLSFRGLAQTSVRESQRCADLSFHERMVVEIVGVRCRTIDEAGQAQPMLRPFRKSGRNAIQRVVVTVKT